MNYKIVIDAGHGGSDPGASGNGIIEKDYNLKISQYMYELFKEKGIKVNMTRNSDITLTPEERVKKALSFYGDNPNVIIISNHINAGGGDGAEVLYALRNTSDLSNLILENLEKAGQNVRDAFQKRLPSNPSKDYYFMHRNTGSKTEPIIVEYGFLDSNLDDPQQLKDNWKLYTEAVVNAVLKYINVENSMTYQVKDGDNLYSIALKYNTTVDNLKKLNKLKSNTLKIGQILNVPQTVEKEDTNNYVVKSGDNLYSIALKFNTTVDEIKTLNNLNSNLLSIGQILKIPQNIIEEKEIYTVTNGDTLYSIALKFNTSVDEIKTLNNLDSGLLSIGQKLKIPVENINITKPNTYIVQKGDTLYSIAKKFNTTVDNLKDLNNLNSNNLSLNQELTIPESFNTYIVKNGDTLWNIAKKFDTTVDNLKDLNNLNSNLLTIGQKLIVKK